MKWLAALFAVFILAVILLADFGYLREPLAALHAFPFGDKLGHFGLIGILSFLVISSSIQAVPARGPGLVAAVTGLILLVIFTAEEASQVRIHGRDASLADLSANWAGIVAFGFLAWLTNRARCNFFPERASNSTGIPPRSV